MPRCRPTGTLAATLAQYVAFSDTKDPSSPIAGRFAVFDRPSKLRTRPCSRKSPISCPSLPRAKG